MDPLFKYYDSCMADLQKQCDDERQRIQKNLEDLQKLTDVVHELNRKRDTGEIIPEEHKQSVNEATGIKLTGMKNSPRINHINMVNDELLIAKYVEMKEKGICNDFLDFDALGRLMILLIKSLKCV